MEELKCTYPTKAVGVFFVSKYMIKKYGADEAISRTLKRKDCKIYKTLTFNNQSPTEKTTLVNNS